MRKIVLQILAVLLLGISIQAQGEVQKPILIDEFGKLNLEDILARLDNLTINLSKSDNTKALIRIYGGNENCFTCHYQRGSLINAILKNTKRFPSENYTIQYCTKNKEDLRTELYLVPMSAKIPSCEEILQIPKQSVLFDKIYFYYNDNKLSALEDIYVDVIESAHGNYSRKALTVIKDILDKSTDSKIYVIAYLGTNPEYNYEDINEESVDNTIRKLDKKSLAKKMFLCAKKEFAKYGIKPTQIELIEGGYIDGKRELEFWFVPKGGEIPKPKPNYFPKRKNKK